MGPGLPSHSSRTPAPPTSWPCPATTARCWPAPAWTGPSGSGSAPANEPIRPRSAALLLCPARPRLLARPVQRGAAILQQIQLPEFALDALLGGLGQGLRRLREQEVGEQRAGAVQGLADAFHGQLLPQLRAQLAGRLLHRHIR